MGDVGSAGGPPSDGNLKREVKTEATNRFMVTRSPLQEVLINCYGNRKWLGGDIEERGGRKKYQLRV